MTDTSPGDANVAVLTLTPASPSIDCSNSQEDKLVPDAVDSGTPLKEDSGTPRKFFSRRKQKKKSSIMRRLAPRIPKFICYFAFGLLILFSLKKLNEMSRLQDEENKQTTQASYDGKRDINLPVTTIIDIVTDIYPQKKQPMQSMKVIKAKPNVETNKKPLEIKSNKNQKKTYEKGDKLLVKTTETTTLTEDVQERKLLKHSHSSDLRYHVSNDDGRVVNAVKEFNLKQLPSHVAEIIELGPEPDDESDPSNAVFVTGSSTETFNDVLQLVQSIQKFLPRTKMVVFDIGLQTHERLLLESGCNVEIRDLLLGALPEHIRQLPNNNWRPLAMQMALAEFHFIVWINPNIRLAGGRIQPLLKLASTQGVGVVANAAPYSTFTVTHPSMFDYLPTNNMQMLKLQPHLEIKLLAVHSSDTVQESFMKWLALCAGDSECLSPPGATSDCEGNLRSMQYAGCHRYEESAINILLKNLYQYDIDEFYIRNLIAVPTLADKAQRTLKKCPKRTKDL